MGKQRRQRKKPHKENPTGLPSVRDVEEIEDEEVTSQDRENALRKVYEEVQSPNIEEKLSGLQTLESMSCDANLAVKIATDGIAKMIGPLLIDPSIPVRAPAASALRHIADNGKEEAYSSLLKDDIMTPLSTLLKQYHSNWQPKLDKEKGKINDEKEAFIQTVTLLWTLCENNESAVKYSNEEDLISVLIKFFDISIYGIEIAIVTAHCLLSLSEDNHTAIQKLKGFETVLLELLNLEGNNYSISDVYSLKSAVSGLLVNMSDSFENDPMNVICKIISVLSEILDVDNSQLLSNLASIIPHEKNAYSSSSKKKVQESRRLFGAQQEALEILANLCSDEQEANNDSDLEDADIPENDEEYMDDEPLDDKLCKMGASLPLEITEVFSSRNIVKKVCTKTMAVEKDMEEILEQNVEGKAILKQMHTLRCRAYLCLNNLISSLEIDTLDGVENVYSLWSQLGTVVFKEANPNDIELLESATAAMRAALQRLSEAKAHIFNQLTLADIQPMLNGERQCSNANIRANLIRILGNLAMILMNTDTVHAHELIKHVSTFLLDSCTVESEAWVIAEAIDSIMDIYSEDETDQLAKEIQLVNKLRSLLSPFKNKVRQQKKRLGDNAAVVSTVNANISRFIKYKEKRISNIT